LKNNVRRFDSDAYRRFRQRSRKLNFENTFKIAGFIAASHLAGIVKKCRKRFWRKNFARRREQDENRVSEENKTRFFILIKDKVYTLAFFRLQA